MTLSDIFPRWKEGKGIFYYLSSLDDITLPWGDYDLSQDYDYIAYSGNKEIAPIIRKIWTVDGTLSDNDATKLAYMLWHRYGKNWTKLFETLELEYNPIENYNMIEDGTDGSSVHDVNGVIKSHNSNSTRNRTSSTSQRMETLNNSGAYGFNSTDASPTDTVDGINDGTGSASENISDGTIESDNENSTRDIGNASQHHLTRTGNIGVTTSQQMIEAERSLWVWKFWESVYKDIDKVLTLRVY